jgi:hypothetical protein
VWSRTIAPLEKRSVISSRSVLFSFALFH